MLARTLILPLLMITSLALSGCGQAPGAGKPRVIASTSIVADVVRQIAGDTIELSSLVPLGTDTHSFAPTPQDVARVSEAQLIFISGAGYEEFLQPLMQNAGGKAELVELSAGIALREMSASELAADEDAAAEGAGHSAKDPHTWTDPNNMKYWTAAISASLSRISPANAALYAANAAAYDAKLGELDGWISQQFAGIPPERRLLVTDHAVFGYLADRYGLTQAGTIVPGSSSAAQPSAQELAALQDHMRSLGVKAIFVGNVVNPALAERLAEDTGVRLVTVLTESLTPPDGPGATYLEYMRSNVSAMAAALR